MMTRLCVDCQEWIAAAAGRVGGGCRPMPTNGPLMWPAWLEVAYDLRNLRHVLDAFRTALEAAQAFENHRLICEEQGICLERASLWAAANRLMVAALRDYPSTDWPGASDENPLPISCENALRIARPSVLLVDGKEVWRVGRPFQWLYGKEGVTVTYRFGSRDPDG